MSNIKKSVVIISFILLLILIIHTGRMFMINNNNFYALEAGSVEEANNQLLSMDITTSKDFSTKDFYGEYVPGTSFVITYQGRVYYDQGYYMVYKNNYEPVYCIDPLKTAWAVTNKDSLDEINNHEFASLSAYQQDLVSRLAMAAQGLYDETNDPEYLVAGQLLVWQAVGAGLESYTQTLQDNIDEVNQSAQAYDFSDVARGGTGDFNYYDTDGQDLVGVQSVVEPTTDTDDPDVVGPVDGDITIEKTSDVEESAIVENGQEVTYKLIISNHSDEAWDINVEDALADENIKTIDSAFININGQETPLTINDLKNGLTLENLAPKDSVEITYTVTVDFSSDYEEGDPIVNTAKVCIVDSDVCDEDIETIGTTDESFIEAQKLISDENGNNDGIAQNEEQLTFTISVFNGSDIDKSVVVKDELNDPNIVYNLNNPVYIDGEDSGYTVQDLSDSGVVVENIKSGESSVVTFEATAAKEFTFTSSDVKISNFSNVCYGDDCLDANGYIPVGGFEIDKSVIDGNQNQIAEPGEDLTYTISIKNYDDSIDSMTVKDTLEKNYVNYNESTPLTIIPSNVITDTNPTLGDLENGLTLNNLTPGEDITITYTVSVENELTIVGDNHHINNIVDVCSEDTCLSDGAAISVDEDFPIIPGGDRAVIKTITDESGDGIAQPGENITFDVIIVNGDKTSANFLVQDNLSDENIIYDLSNSLEEKPGSNGSFGKANPTVGDLKEGVNISVLGESYFEFTFDATVSDPLEDSTQNEVYNTITACIEEDCSEGGGILPLDSVISFEVNKDVTDANDNGVVEENEEFVYDITITNTGNDKTDITLKDSLADVNVEFNLEQSLNLTTSAVVEPQNPVLGDMVVENSELLNPNTNSGIKIEGLEPGQTVELSFTGVGKDTMLDGTYVLTNVVQVVWEDDSKIGFDIDTANIFTNSDGGDLLEEISVNKTSTDANGDGIVSPGEEILYSINISNPTGTTQEVVVKDLFDDINIQYDMESSFTFTSNSSNSSVDGVSLNDLAEGVTVTMAPNSSATITYSGIALLEPEDYSATIDYNEVEFCQDTNCDNSISIIDKEGKTLFDINKTAYQDGKEVFEAVDGDSVNYEIVVENTGNMSTGELLVSDEMDDNLMYDPTQVVKITDDNGSEVQTTPSSVTVEEFITSGVVINNMEPGDKVVISYDVQVYVEDIFNENDHLSNLATVCGEDSTCVSDGATITVDPINKPIDPTDPGKISLVKNIIGEAGDGTASPGDNLEFEIYLVNSGENSISTVVQDNMDDPNIIYDETQPLNITPEYLYTGQTVGDLKKGITLDIPARSLVTIKFSGKVKSGDDFDENQSYVTNLVSACYDGDTCTDGGGSLTLPDRLGFSLDKDVLVNGVDTTSAALGDNLTYNFSIKNTKNTSIENFLLRDLYPTDFMTVPDVEFDILNESGEVVNTTPSTPKTSDLFADGVVVQEELMPGESLTFTYDATITDNLHGSPVDHLTNLIVASSDVSLKSQRTDSILNGDYLYAFDTATVTLDDTYPTVDDFSVLKTVVDGNKDGIAQEGEELNYTVYVSNLSDQEQVLKIQDLGDMNGNAIIREGITVVPESTPTTGDLTTNDLEVTLAPSQTIQISYVADVTEPFNDPSASFIYNRAIACDVEDPTKCSDSATLVPLEETKGFDISKDVEINRAGAGDLDETTEPVIDGDILDYTIRITNNRNTDLENVKLVDVIDTNIPVDPTQTFDIKDMNGVDIDISSDKTLAVLISDEGITIPSIPSGTYVDITFSTLPLTSKATSASYNHLTNIAKACVPSDTKNQSIETEEGICASDAATVTNDVTNPPSENVSVIKNMYDENGDGIAQEGEGLNFEIYIVNKTSNEQNVTITDALDDPNIVYDMSQKIDITPSTVQTVPEEHVVGNLVTGLEVMTKPGNLIEMDFSATVASPLNVPTNTEVTNEVTVCIEDDCSEGGGSIDLGKSNGFLVEKTVAINGTYVDETNPLSYIVAPSDKLTYKITLTNNRNTDLENIAIKDVIDGSIIVDLDDSVNPLIINSSDTTNPDHLNPSGKTISSLFDGTLVIDQMKIGETITLMYNAQAKSTINTLDYDEFSNIVQACTTPVVKNQSSLVGSQICGSATVTVTTNPIGIPDPDDKIGVVKNVKDEGGDGIADYGEVLNYDVYVYNPRETTESVSVVDLLDDVNLDYDLKSPLNVVPEEYLTEPNPAQVGDLVEGVVLTLPQGGVADVSYQATVKNPLEDTGKYDITNIVEVCYEDGSGCSDGGGIIDLPGASHFTLDKIGTIDGEIIDEDKDIIPDGSIITYYVQIQNTGNLPLENIKMIDIQDDNLVSDYSDPLQLVESETTQPDFDITSVTLDGEAPQLGDFFAYTETIGYEDGIVIPLLDPAKKITFKYESEVQVKTGDELQATNLVQACSNIDSTSRDDAILIGDDLCSIAGFTILLEDIISKDSDIKVLKLGLDGLESGTTNLVLEPGEDITYYVFVKNDSAEEYNFSGVDVPDSNINFAPNTPVEVYPEEYLTYPNKITVEDLITSDNNINFTIPGNSTMVLEYKGNLKTGDTGLDLTSDEVTNNVEFCNKDLTPETCGYGDSNLDILGDSLIDIQKTVTTKANVDLDSDSILDVTNNEKLSYNLHVSNKGNQTNDIKVKDILPTDYVFVPDTSISLNYTLGLTTEPANPTIEDLIKDGVVFKDIKPGQEFDINFDVYVKGDLTVNGVDYSGYITNVVEACNTVSTKEDEGCIYSQATVEYGEPTFPFDDNMVVIKNIYDVDTDSDEIASLGEELTFDIQVFNLGEENKTYTVGDTLEDVNVDYDSSLDSELIKIDGTGNFVAPSNTVLDLKDDPSTPEVEGVEVNIDPRKKIEFTFKAKVFDPLVNEYNSHITNTVNLTDGVETVTGMGNIELPVYSRMDVRKSYTTNRSVDVDTDPLETDNLYYVSEAKDIVNYKIEYKNIGTTDINEFEIKDELNKTYYSYSASGPVNLTSSSGITSSITIEDLISGYTYAGTLKPGESLTAEFTVQVNEKISEVEDGFVIPNIAFVCYESISTGDDECTSAGSKTPVYRVVDPIDPPIKPDQSFIIDKWIDDSEEVGGNGDNYLQPNERVRMHILINNNTVALEQFDPMGDDLTINISDDLTDPNFVYNLNNLLTTISMTRSINVTDNSDVVSIVNAKLENIDRSSGTKTLDVNVIDGETLEITFDTVASNTLK